ncbi:MAG: hypothetical protein PVJ09_01140 [Candidatus Woesebacteria bacterium]
MAERTRANHEKRLAVLFYTKDDALHAVEWLTNRSQDRGVIEPSKFEELDNLIELFSRFNPLSKDSESHWQAITASLIALQAPDLINDLFLEMARRQEKEFLFFTRTKERAVELMRASFSALASGHEQPIHGMEVGAAQKEAVADLTDEQANYIFQAMLDLYRSSNLSEFETDNADIIFDQVFPQWREKMETEAHLPNFLLPDWLKNKVDDYYNCFNIAWREIYFAEPIRKALELSEDIYDKA